MAEKSHLFMQVVLNKFRVPAVHAAISIIPRHIGGFDFENSGRAGYFQPSYANVVSGHDQHGHGLGGHGSYEREKFHRIIPDSHSRGYNGGHAPNAPNGHHHAHGVGGHAHSGLESRY